MKTVVAVGIDSAPQSLIDVWIEQGRLPELAALRSASARAVLRGCDTYRAETPWTCILTGCEPEQTGYWTCLKFRPSDYGIEDAGAYDFAEYPPFYALSGEYPVIAFDLPQMRLSDAVDGVQVVSWGAHSPLAPRGSRPPGLLDEIEGRFGSHPALLRDHATLWRPREQARLIRELTVGIERRADICAELMRRQPWRLFLTVFGETHSAGHYLWHLSQPDHPLSSRRNGSDNDPLLHTYRSIDRAIGRLRAAAPPDAVFLVFSQEGMEPNCMDLPSMVFLPELLYRLAFPGRRGLGAGETTLDGIEAPPRSWVPALWATQAVSGSRRFLRRRLPSALSYRIDRLWNRADLEPLPPCEAGEMPYQAATWYRHLWPRMKAFALPSFAEGYVRLNVRGREAHGLVETKDYDRVCDELTAEISSLVDARSGKPIVRDVRRTRTHGLEQSITLPDADLIVLWASQPTDTADSPTRGRIGPVPFYRSGSHTAEGFAWICAPGIEPGTQLSDGRPTSLAPTVLALLGAKIPDYMKQAPLGVVR